MRVRTNDMPRRDFLSRLWAGLGVLAASVTGYIGLRFLASQTSGDEFGGVITVGAVDDFLPGTVTAFSSGRFYLARMADGGFLALHFRCTHLACVVLWHEAEGQFYCPCHGSRFHRDGTVLNRPALRSLRRFPVTFEDGQVLVNTGTLIERDTVQASDVAYPDSQGTES